MDHTKLRLGFLAAMVAGAVFGFAALPGGASADGCPPAGCSIVLLPDLRVTDLTLVTILGQRYVRVEVKNLGTANAGAYSVALKGANGADLGPPFLDNNGLVAGGTQYFYHKMGACPPGALMLAFVEAIVDPNNQVIELSNGNNTREESWFFYC